MVPGGQVWTWFPRRGVFPDAQPGATEYDNHYDNSATANIATIVHHVLCLYKVFRFRDLQPILCDLQTHRPFRASSIFKHRELRMLTPNKSGKARRPASCEPQGLGGAEE